jgi:hypothetical protein
VPVQACNGIALLSDFPYHIGIAQHSLFSSSFYVIIFKHDLIIIIIIMIINVFIILSLSNALQPGVGLGLLQELLPSFPV